MFNLKTNRIMKKLNIFWFIIVICLISQYAYSQNIGDLNGIYYQAVAVDENGKEIVGMDVEGKPLYEKAIGVRFTITKGLNGIIQWEETHTTATDKYGLFSLVIGQGISTGNGTYTRLLDIPWIDADQFLKVEIATKNDGNYKLVSNQRFMSVPYSFYTDDIADNAITTAKILNETILAEDIATGAVETSELLNETILAEDIATGSVTTSELLDSTIINEDIHTSAVDSRILLDSAIINEDLHTSSVDSRALLNETILAEDINTGAVATSELLDSTIINEDVHTGAIDSRALLDETILAEDIATGSVETSELLNETILAEDIATGAITTSELLDSTIINEDIHTGTVDSRTLLNETILAEDIASGAVETSEILDSTILNDDIANGTIDITTKVTGVLPVANGGMGNATLTDGRLLVGSGTNPIKAKVLASADTSIQITQTADSIIIKGKFAATEVTSDPAGTFVINNLPAGSTYTSNAINAFAVSFGDIIIGSVDVNLQGCMLTAYVSQPNVIRVSIFNGTGTAVNLGTVNVRVFIVR
jgi:hypothetical protein